MSAADATIDGAHSYLAAADRLAELEAEVERLREANFILTQSENADTALAEIALAAERALNDKLAEALQVVVDRG